MSYLPAGLPLPRPESWEQPFWDYCRQRSLRFQTCADCGQVRHPPMPSCPACLSFRHDWVEATNDATLFTYTVVHHASHPSLRTVVPYNVAVVLFPSLQSVRLIANIVDCSNEDLEIGMPLTLVWDVQADWALPRFRPREVR